MLDAGRVPQALILKGSTKDRFVIPEGTPWPELMRPGRKKHRGIILPPGFIHIMDWANAFNRTYEAGMQHIRNSDIPGKQKYKNCWMVPANTPWPIRKKRYQMKKRTITKKTEAAAKDYLDKLTTKETT